MSNPGLVVWSPEYATGVKQVDDQHQNLIAMIRQFQDAMLEARAREGTKELLRKLRVYAAVHFAMEERLMDEHAYPEKETHKAAHARLAGQVAELQKRLEEQKAIAGVEVMLFMRDWLTGHILSMDKTMAPFLRQAGVE